METLCINNITIYPGIKPPKGIIMKEIKLEKITVWLTKCKNIYYLCEKEHPIGKYGVITSTYLLCHLFYLIKNAIIPSLENQNEILIFNNFLSGCYEYLRKYSYNAYNESFEDEILRLFYFDNYLPVSMHCFNLSFFNSQIKKVKYEHHTIKNNVKKTLFDFQNDFEEMVRNIVSKISVQKDEISEKPKMVEIATQVNFVENAWKIKPTLKKTIETQTDFKKISKSVQTIIENKSIEIQTDPIEETKVIINETKVIVNEPKKKKKEKQEIFTFTEEEYAKMMSLHRKDVERAREESYEKYSKNFTNYVSEAKFSVKQLYNILLYSEPDKTYESIMIFNILFCANNFHLNILETKTGKIRISILPFMRFWRNIVLPVIDNLSHPLFGILSNLWQNLEITIKNSKIVIDDNHLNVLFGHYATIIQTEVWDLQSHMHPFFIFLFRRCRNISLFLGLIRSYEIRLKEGKDIPEEFLKNFERLYTTLSERELLYLNTDNISINPGCSMQILYNIGDIPFTPGVTMTPGVKFG